MGMMDWVNDEDGDEDADGAAGGDDTDMDDFDEFDDEFDDFEEDFDDEFDDFEDGAATNESGEDFDDFEEDFDDEFDDFGGGSSGGGANGDVSEKLAEFEDRIGELETELGGLSSTMNTVREENKQIGETVDDLDDTIRKLLDIYEMVTRGINPFVDDAREMGGLEHGDGAFGLFDSEEEDEDDLDPNVANADAESFFDEDFGDLDPEESEARAEAVAEDELTEAEADQPGPIHDAGTVANDPDGAVDAGNDADADADDAGGAVSFDDLKAEYDEDNGWDDDKDADVDATDSAVEGDDSDDEEDETDVEADTAIDVDAEPTLAAEEDDDGEEDGDEAAEVEDGTAEVEDGTADVEDEAVEVEDEAAEVEDGTDSEEDAPVDDADQEPTPTHADQDETGLGRAEAVTDDEMFVGDAVASDDTAGSGVETDAGPPPTPGSTGPDAAGPVGRERLGSERAEPAAAYLSALPSTYVAESVAMEWMRFLVSAGGPLGASRALRLYEDFGWISSSVRTSLDTYLRSVASPRDDEQNGSLTAEHHETSLSYVSRLGDHAPTTGALDALAADGGHDGIRR